EGERKGKRERQREREKGRDGESHNQNRIITIKELSFFLPSFLSFNICFLYPTVCVCQWVVLGVYVCVCVCVCQWVVLGVYVWGCVCVRDGACACGPRRRVCGVAC